VALDNYFDELRDTSRPLVTANLPRLSGLDREAEAALRSAWTTIAVERRREIVERMLELAEDNVEFDFTAVFGQGLQDPDATVRHRCVNGLWEADDRAFIPRLIERMTADSDIGVRAAAATVLGHYAMLAQTGKLLRRDSDRIYQALLKTVANASEPIEVRRRALESLGVFQVPEVRGWIQWGYAQGEPALRQSALFAMGRSADAAFLPTVIAEMESPAAAMRYEAANAAGEIGEEEAIPHLMRLLRDGDAQVRHAAVQALAAIGGPRARKQLRELAMGTDEVLSEAAREALEALEKTDEGGFGLSLPR